MKTALITGITGQDGSYLAELLLKGGYEVHGIKRRGSSLNTQRVDHLMDNPCFHLHYGDLTDATALADLLARLPFDEVYNLGGQSHVGVSFEMPDYTAQTVALGTLRILEAMRTFTGDARLYQASSSEMFGNEPGPQSETTRFAPRSPYACAKVFAHQLVQHYREAYGLHASCGILFNHESPRRGETFVTRKITRAVARIKAGLQDKLYLGPLLTSRDWGFAGDYVRAMWLMLQQDKPDDYVIGTGQSFSVLTFCELAFGHAGLFWQDHIIANDARYERPAEVFDLKADATKARTILQWRPTVEFTELVAMMVDADMKELRDAR